MNELRIRVVCYQYNRSILLCPVQYPKPETKNHRIHEIRAKKRSIWTAEKWSENWPHDRTQTLAGDGVPSLRLMNGNTFVGCAFAVSSHLSPPPQSRFSRRCRSSEPSRPRLHKIPVIWVPFFTLTSIFLYFPSLTL